MRAIDLHAHPEDFEKFIRGLRNAPGGKAAFMKRIRRLGDVDEAHLPGIRAFIETLDNDVDQMGRTVASFVDVLSEGDDLGNCLRVIKLAHEAVKRSAPPASDPWRGFNQLVRDLGGADKIKGTWFQLDFVDAEFGFDEILRYEATGRVGGSSTFVTNGRGGLDIVRRNRADLPESEPLYLEFKSGPDQEIAESQIYRHIDRVVGEDWRRFAFVLNDAPRGTNHLKQAGRFLGAILGKLDANTLTAPAPYDGMVTWLIERLANLPADAGGPVVVTRATLADWARDVIFTNIDGGTQAAHARDIVAEQFFRTNRWPVPASLSGATPQ